ncbi:MAG: hypothetical protein WBA86_05755 [Nodosilinea sp.]
MFHETSASGPVWTSAFWLSTVQRNLVKRLVNLSDHILTSKQLYAEILQCMVNQQLNPLSSDKSTIPALPVFSNVGEPESVIPLDARDRTLVIFGGATTRSRSYKLCQNELTYACEQLNIEKIIDIGPNNRFKPSDVGNIPVDILGPRPATEISQILSSAFAGFIHYPVDFLGKSTVFASYCAHGVLPIVGGGAQSSDADGLIAWHNYWHLDLTCLDINALIPQKIASNAHAWYQAHNLGIQASQFSLFLSSKN